MYRLLRALLRVSMRVFLAGRFRIEGREHVPARGGLLVCTNHISSLDPALVPAFLPREDSWSLGKAEYFAGSRIVAWWFRTYHGIPIVRHSADRAALRRALGVLREGHVLFIYPEGTRRVAGGMVRPEPGAGFLASMTSARVLPVAIVGSREVLGKGMTIPERSDLRLTYGTPFTLLPTHPDGTRVSHQEAADAISLAIAELLPPDLRGEFQDLAYWRSRVGALVYRSHVATAGA